MEFEGIMSGRGRPGGNPAFGTKYKFEPIGEEPLSSRQFQIRLPQSHMDSLMEMPSNERNRLVRGAIAEILGQDFHEPSIRDPLLLDAVRDAIANKQAALAREQKKKRPNQEMVWAWQEEIEKLAGYL